MVTKETKTIEVSDELYERSRMCTYHFRFDMNAGPYDIIQVTFDDAVNTGVGYAIGTTYSDA